MKAYKPRPVTNTLNKVPKTDNCTMADKLTKNSRSYSEYAESKIIGGKRTLKKRELVKL